MIKISLIETLFIGFITMICGLIIHYIVNNYGNENIKNENIFSKNINNIYFYIILFIIGISIHFFIKYIEFNKWYCKQVCSNDNCVILCTLPINDFTKILITK
jgi:hypothetical protein